MATKPKSVTLTDSSTDIVNATLNEAAIINPTMPTERADGTLKSLQTVGMLLVGNSAWANQFINTLMNRIVLTVIQSMAFENPWKRFKRGLLEAGDAVEEIAFTLANPHQYNTTEDNQYPQQEIPDLYAAIHKLNYQEYYKQTINRNQLLRAFDSLNGMHNLVQQIIGHMYTAAEWDEYLCMKYTVGWAMLNGFITAKNIPAVTDENMKKIAAIVKGVSNNMTLLSGQYNRYSLPTSTDKSRQIVLMNTNFDASFETEVLAYAFNMDKADIYGTRVFINNFTAEEQARLDQIFAEEEGYTPFTAAQLQTLNNIPMYILDDRFFMIFDYLMEMTDFFNPEKLYWNYWLHTWKVLSTSPFVNAVGFSPDAGTGTVTLTITPATVTVAPGKTTTLTANAATTGSFVPKILWTVSGNTSVNTMITQYGKLKIGKDEKAATLTVTAQTASLNNDTPVSATATITVSGNTPVTPPSDKTPDTPPSGT